MIDRSLPKLDPDIEEVLAAERRAADPDEAFTRPLWRRIEARMFGPRLTFAGPAMAAPLRRPWRWGMASAALAGLLVWSFAAGRPSAPSRGTDVSNSAVPAAPLATAATREPSPPAPVAPEPPAAAPLRPAHARALRPPPRLPSNDEGSLAAEQRVLDRARRALASDDPRAAYRWTQVHAAAFQPGRLDEEADFFAIEALRRLGRVSAARTRQHRFLQAHPQSPLTAAVLAELSAGE